MGRVGPLPPRLSAAKLTLLERWRDAPAPATSDALVDAEGLGRPRPLSLAQERLWFLEQLDPGTSTYNICFCAELRGRLQPDLLAQSLHDLAIRHETLRTSIDTAGSVLSQHVSETGPSFIAPDFRHLSSEEARSKTLEHVTLAVSEPFDLERGPLGRVVLCQEPDGDVLAIVAHHLVADGWSLRIALQELSALYEARAKEGSRQRPPLPLQYGDFALWQRDPRRDSEWQRDLDYWRQELVGIEPLVLPTDRRRPRVMKSDGDWRGFRLDTGRSSRLRMLARHENATLFMVLLAAWALVLRKLSAQEEFAIGTNVANRQLPGAFAVIGNFVNLVPLRVDLRGDPTFGELLRRVRRTCTRAFAHQQVPFERVVREINQDRDMSRTALAQALLVLQPPITDLRFAGMTMEPIEIGSATARADLELHVWDQPALAGRLVFNTHLFDAITVERILRRITAVLDRVVADPGCKVSDVSLLLPEERPLLSVWGRGPDRDYPMTPVHDLITRVAEADPNGLAVVAGRERLSRSTLETRSNRVAQQLRILGAVPEARVAVCCDRSTWMLVAVLAVLKSGAAYVPLDPRYPDARLATMTRDSQSRIVLTDSANAARFRGLGISILPLDGDVAVASQESVAPAASSVLHPDQLAYVVYTSGSTGAPKGVQISHRSLSNFVQYELERPGMRQGEVVACIASLAFDASVAELFAPLVVGGTVVIASADDVMDGVRLHRLLKRSHVSWLLATPTTWRFLVDAGGLGRRGATALSGAERLPPDLAEVLIQSHDSAWNLYGPTESTVYSHAERLRPGSDVSLGQPVANARVYLVDDALQEVPIGAIGEICIGGPGVSRGYLRRPELTADRFVPDPLSSHPGSRLYRTGDLARYRLDGSLEFVGRRDGQVKLRGQRIELGEIEAVLSEHSGVAAAAVALDAANTADAQLVACVVPARTEAAAITWAQLRTYLGERLPTYMIPARCVFVEELPKTPGGKLDRSQLPRLGHNRPDASSAYVAPRTQIEAEIADHAARALAIDRIGVFDDFFELGGHSLLAARLLVELRERYAVDLVLQKVFLNPTVAALAAQVQSALKRKLHLSDPDERLRSIVEEIPDEVVASLLEQMREGNALQSEAKS